MEHRAIGQAHLLSSTKIIIQKIIIFPQKQRVGMIMPITKKFSSVSSEILSFKVIHCVFRYLAFSVLPYRVQAWKLSKKKKKADTLAVPIGVTNKLSFVSDLSLVFSESIREVVVGAGEEKNLFSYPPRFKGWGPWIKLIKDRLTREKNRFDNLCAHGSLQRNMTQVGGLNLVTCILSQRVTKCGEEARQSKRGLKPLGEGVNCGKVSRTYGKQGLFSKICYAESGLIGVQSSQMIKRPPDKSCSLPGTGEDTFTNVNLLYKCKFPLQKKMLCF